MKKILVFLILITFILYWSVTLIFTMPENFLSISLHKEGAVFNNLFSQKWSFFAPPPNFNDRIYYSFVSKKDSSVKTYEIIEKVNQRKQDKAPFNWNEDLLDYVLSNSSIGVNEQIYEIQQYLKFESDEQFPDSTIEKITINSIQNSYQFQTLVNYAKYVAKNNHLNADDYLLRLRITKKNLPKFFERNLVTKKQVEELIFQSDLIEIK